MEAVGCALCGSLTAVPEVEVRDLLLDRRGTYRLVRCARCSLVFLSPRPSAAAMQEHYPPEYDVHRVARPGEVRGLARVAIAHGVRKRLGTIARHKRSGRLLDVGAATGTFLAGVRRVTRAYALHGLEPSPGASAAARTLHGLDVWTGPLEAHPYPAASFDVITLWDVLEHLHEPRAALRALHELLAADGVLVVRVPNVESWAYRVFGRSWAGLDAPRHLYVFGRSTLTRLLEEGGFRVLEVRSRIGEHPALTLSVRFWLTEREVAPAARARIMAVLDSPIAKLAAAPALAALGRGGHGALISVVCAKVAT